jgi:hypothetical protein
MARIPDVNDLGRNIPQPARGVSSADLSAPARALQGFGQAVSQIGGALAEKEDKFNYAEAQSAFLKRKTEIMASFDGDNDYTTFGDRFNQQIAKAREDSLAMIRNNNDQRSFQIESNNDITRGYEQIRGLARNKEVDAGIASLNQTITSNREAALSSRDEQTRESFVRATGDAIEGAFSRGYISAQQVQEIKQKSAVDYATSSIAIMKPQQQVQALQSPGMASLIPADVRKKMLDAAAFDSSQDKIGNIKIEMMNPGYFSGLQAGNAIDGNSLMSAVIGQESGGRQIGADGRPLTSKKGAIGVAQVMPGTAPDAAALAGLPWDENRYKTDADYNAALGTAYLNKQLKDYGGNPVLALAAYNAGPERVKQWVKQFGDPNKGEITNEAFANAIPFQETQNYVASVLGNATKISAQKSIIGSPEFALLDGAQKARVIEQTYNVIDTATSAQHLNIQQRMQEDVARVNAGVAVSNPVTVVDFTSVQPMNSTPADRMQAVQQFKQYQQTLALQPAFQAIINSPADTGLATVNALRPNEGDADFAFKLQRFTAAQQKYQQTITAREKDPGGWMVQNVADVKQAYDVYQQDPSQGAALAQQVLIQKQRLGIKSKDVLPDIMADGILQQISNNKEQDVAAIQSVGQQFGPYSQQVMQQVQKKAGPVLQVVMATENPRAANALWQNRDVKTADMRSSINTAEKGSADTADSEWATQSKDFANTMVGQPGGVSVWNTFNDQGRRLTYLNMQRGMSASDAAAQSYQDMLGTQYQIKDTWRVPTTASVDVKDVSDGADKFLNDLKPTDIIPLMADPRLSQETNLQQSVDRLKDNAEWITNADETGLMLTMNGLVVNSASGNPITVSYSELAQLGSTSRSYFNQLSKEIAKPRIYTPGQATTEMRQRNEEVVRQLGGVQIPTGGPSMAEGMRQTYDNLYQRSGSGD